MVAKCECSDQKLTRVIAVEKISASASEDASGNVDQTDDTNWVQCGREWAQCITRGSREFVNDGQVREEVTHQWIIRWSSRGATYTAAMRLRMDGRKFNISAPPVNINEMNEWLRIDTIEVPSV